MRVLLKVTQFLRLVDENGQLSMTNLGMYAALYRLITTNGSYADVGAFFIAAAAYGHKKIMNNVTEVKSTVNVVEPPNA